MLEQTNFGEVRGPDWKAWEDKTFPSRDIPSHEASKCAGLQGEEPFARYHLALHRAKHQQKLDITNQLILRDIALQAGLDVARWEEDMKSGAAIPLIAQDHGEAAAEGIFGVPTLYFGSGKPVFVKLDEGDWEGKDDAGLFDAVRAAVAERPYLLELKTPESAQRAEASRKRYAKYFASKA
ncbi:MAG: hypothetical protein A3J27_09280 [Candidatus Tectomicrobia bacterium RIFCSPLOWO2_12_FULL_69_37]|nr:MAG: hypothetical protein A3J27_09280 [Candidatus Tectomicrobia bacterium RIFCSPLOWO2_12_FULL_69_37]